MLALIHQAKLVVTSGLIFLLVACGGQSGSPGSGGQTTSPEPALDTMSITVNVTNTLGFPVEGALVSVVLDGSAVEDARQQTDSAGNATLSNVLEQSNIVIHIQKEGYAVQLKPVDTPHVNQPAYYDLVIIERGEPIIFKAGESTEIVTTDGAKLELEDAVFEDKDGNPVSGDIQVNITPVDVSTEAGAQAFPGSFSGILDDGSETEYIVSLGTTEFSFYQNGEELQLSEGESAVIEIPMYVNTYPNGNPVNVGDNIPLWYLNENSGIWEQEGVGEVVVNLSSPIGLSMRATVSHFSWWNTDWYPEEEERFNIDISVLVINEDGIRTELFDDSPARLHYAVGNIRRNAYIRDLIGSTIEVEVFEGLWCFSSSANLEIDESLEPVESEEVCEYLTGDTTIILELRLENAGFSVTPLVRETGTIGGEFGACGDRPRIRARSAFPLTHTIASGALPDGLSIQPNGLITGTPTRAGQYTVQIDVAENINGERGEWEPVILDFTISPELDLDPPPLHAVFQIGYPYSVLSPFSTDGGLAPYRYALTPDGGVPPGMTMDTSDTTISGTPGRWLVGGVVSRYYSTPINVEVKDQNCATTTNGYWHDAIWAPKLEGEPDPIYVGEEFSFTFTNVEGPIDRWAQIRGLPAWLTLNTITGEITGIPGRENVGTSGPIFIRAEGIPIPPLGNIHGEGIGEFTVTVLMREPVLLDILDNFTVATGQSITITPTNTGGEADYWEVDNLPTWARFDTNTGEITGTPHAVAFYDNIILRATNSAGSSETSPFAINIVPQVSAPQLSGTPNSGEVSTNYAFSVANSGGIASQWTITGTLPAGLNFSNGTLSGTPSQAGIYSGIEVSASNAGGNSQLPISIVINKGQQQPLRFSSAGPLQKLDSDPTFINSVRGGSGNGLLHFSSSNTDIAVVNSLTGEVDIGLPGQATITVTKAEDINYLLASANYLVVVSSSNVIGGTPYEGTVDQAYSWTPSVTGATIVSWGLHSGSFPTGLSLNTATGEISGTPSEVGTSEFVLRGNTADSNTHTKDFSIQIKPPLVRPNLWNDTNIGQCTFFGEACWIDAELGSNYDYTYTAETESVQDWSTSGELPTGLTFDASSGRLSGTFTASGQFSFSVNASNALGSDLFSITFDVKQAQAPLNFENIGLVTIPITQGNYINAVTGGSSTPPVVFRSSNTSLATVNSSTGEISLLLPGNVIITATKAGDSTYLPTETNFTLSITFPAPSINQIVTYEGVSSAGDTPYVHARLSETPSVTLEYLYTSLASPVEPESSSTNISGTLSELDSFNTAYYVAPRAQSSNGVLSELGDELSVIALQRQQMIPGESGSAFGNAIAMDTDVMVVGASLNDAYASSQDVSVYEFIENEWVLTQKLPALQDWWGNALDVHRSLEGNYRIASGTNASSNFGTPERQGGLATYVKAAVDICGNAIDDNGNGEIDEAGCESVPDGTIYTNGIWVVENYHEGIYPTSVVLSENWIAVGKRNSDNCNPNIYQCGEVTVHRFNELGGWNETADQIILAPQQSTMNFHFGHSLAADGDVLIVGAPGADNGNCYFNCAVHAYRDDSSILIHEARLGGLENMGARAYGHSVAVENNLVVIGDPTASVPDGPTNGDGGDGKVYIYQKAEGGSWADAIETAELTPPGEAFIERAMSFGQSVSITNGIIIVGDNDRDCINGTSSCGAFHWLRSNNEGVYEQENIHTQMTKSVTTNDKAGSRVRASNGKIGVVKNLSDTGDYSQGDIEIYHLP